MALLGTLVLATALAAPPPVPAPTGWVTDLADLLPPAQEESLARLMESYWLGAQEQIAVLTVTDLGGQPIETFALEVARGWQATGAGGGGGVLVVVAQKDRKIRIEVGRHYEGRLPDTLAARVIDHVMVPRFRAGDPAGGIRAGIEAIHAALGGDYAALERSRGGKSGRVAVVGAFPVILLMILFFALRRRTRRLGGGRGGWLTWLVLGSMMGRHGSRSQGWHGGGGGFGSGGFGGGSFGGFSGGGGFGGGGASGGW